MWLLFQAHYGDSIMVSAVTGFSVQVINKWVHHITNGLAQNMRAFIKIPSDQEEQERIAAEFEDKSNIPCVLLALDGTHVVIQSPPLFHEQYINRKGTHSLVFQVASGPRRTILDIAGGLPGCLSDITLWNYSSLRTRFESGEFGPYKILGDAIYPRDAGFFYLPYLVTPEQFQVNYNYWQSRGRMPVECSFGIVKKRFPILAFPWTWDVDKARNTFIACCCVHNILQE
ncbi:unnamed protein product, partial [Heterosigma akashiwo]